MENVVTQYEKKKLIISDENCDFMSITIDTGMKDGSKRKNKINLSKRQTEKLITKLQESANEKIGIKDIDGSNYSKESFLGYRMRVKLKIIDIHGEEYQFDIYTTQTNLDRIRDDLSGITTDKVKIFEIIHHATKEQDDAASKIINETLKDI